MGPSRASDAYAVWVAEWIDRGFTPYIISFMFQQLSGSASVSLDQMRQIIEQVYSIYLLRVVRRPRSSYWHDLRPIWLLAPDLPVFKWLKQSIRDISINDGRHYQGFALEPPIRRTGETIEEHFAAEIAFYCQRCPGLERVHLKPITHDIPCMSEYLFKTIHRGHFDDGHTVQLPKDISETTPYRRRRGNSSIFG